MRSKKDRIHYLSEVVHERGTIRVDELLELSGVSPMTLYRDLAQMEKSGVIRRSRGEVTAKATTITETSMKYRLDQESEDKHRLAGPFEDIITRGTSILLDDSSTALAVISQFRHIPSLTIISNNREIINLANTVPEWDVFALGGYLDRHLDAYYGSGGMEMLRNVRADIAIISAAAVVDGVVYHPYEEIATYKATMLTSARRTYLAVTAPKFERTALHKVADTKEFDAVVTTSRLPARLLHDLRERGARLILT